MLFISGSPKCCTSLPAEILSHIFCLGSSDSDDLNERISVPLLVSHVNSTWRRVALQTQNLWTTIAITGTTPSNQIIRAGVWLQRSKARPCQIYLDFRDTDWEWDEDVHPFTWKRMELVMSVLLPHISRWSHLEVLTDTWAPIYTLLWHCSKRSAPLLRKLSLSRCNAYFARDGETFRPIALKDPLSLLIGGAPRLEHVELAGVHVRWDAPPFSNLRSLHFKYHAREVMPSLSEFVGILSASLQLEDLTLLGWGPCSFEDASSNAQDGMIILPHLRKLTFGFINEEYGARLLSLLCTPQLQHLEIEDLGNGLDLLTTRDSTRLFNKLIQRYTRNDSPSNETRNIEQLHISTVRCSVHSLIHFLSLFPSLRLLILDNVSGALLMTVIAVIKVSGLSSPLRKIDVRHVNCIEGKSWETSVEDIQNQVFPSRTTDLCRTSLVKNGVVHISGRTRKSQ